MPLRAPAATGVSSARVRAVPTAVWLGAIVGASAVLRFAFAMSVPGPGILPDELLYSELAKSLAASGDFLVRGAPYSAWTFGPLYALVIAPAYLIESLPDAYMASKAIDSVLISLAAVPAYLIARRVLDRHLSLLAAGLALMVPGMAYSSRIMTENLFYPVFLFLVLAIVLMLEKPTLRRQLTVLGIIGVACLVRVQAVVLVPALMSAIAVQAGLNVGGSRPWLRRFLLELRRYASGIAVLGGCVALTGWVLLNESLSGRVWERTRYFVADIEAVEVPEWVIYHVAELALVVGIVPVVAFILVSLGALRAGPGDRRLQALVVTTLTVTVHLVFLAGAFATHVDRIVERYMFYVEPLFLIALLVWLQSGTPRSRRPTTAAVAAVLALIPLTLFPRSLFGKVYDAPGLAIWVSIQKHGTSFALGAALVAFGAGALWLVRRSRSSVTVIAPIVTYLVVSSLVTTVTYQVWSRHLVELGIGGDDRAWIDHAVGARADVSTVSATRSRDWDRHSTTWLSEFFNRSVRDVYHLERPPPLDLPSTRVSLSGDVLMLPNATPLTAEYVLSDGPVIVGRRVAAQPQVNLVLYRVDGPVRLTRGRK